MREILSTYNGARMRKMLALVAVLMLTPSADAGIFRRRVTTQSCGTQAQAQAQTQASQGCTQQQQTKTRFFRR